VVEIAEAPRLQVRGVQIVEVLLLQPCASKWDGQFPATLAGQVAWVWQSYRTFALALYSLLTTRPGKSLL